MFKLVTWRHLTGTKGTSGKFPGWAQASACILLRVLPLLAGLLLRSSTVQACFQLQISSDLQAMALVQEAAGACSSSRSAAMFCGESPLNPLFCRYRSASGVAAAVEDQASWVASAFGDCTRICAESLKFPRPNLAFQRRDVTCNSTFGDELPDVSCEHLMKPRRFRLARRCISEARG